MKVSVIIPCHNYGHFLPETLNSLVLQTYPNWEALIIDDGSDDCTPHVASNWMKKDPRINYFRLEKGGVSRARNHGLSLCQGDFIQFLDADDLLSPEKIELQLAAFRKFPDLDLTYTENYYFPDEEPQLRYLDQEFTNRIWLRKFSGSAAYALENLIQNNLAVVSSPMIRKDLALATGGFSEDFAFCEDWKFWFQCVLLGAKIRFVSHPDAYTLIRVHKKSVSQNLRSMQYGEMKLRAWLEDQLKQNQYLSQREKRHLLQLNKSRKSLLVKHMIYLSPLSDLDHLIEIGKLIPWYQVLLYYLKALNRKRKNNRKTHAIHRHNHSVQRTK
ncbi:glycosyltransferase [Algoriphagus lacus]|uniref:Glycosyltransferase n=1 Tax=Algoriphagus lacus TaxID=2056311 RepID=A0A418PNI4_9BACT|nr:glycosyltransferase [Algoriphagus lacus]RIW13388.1 glycosyltransferase [Algoriphagus lacus]